MGSGDRLQFGRAGSFGIGLSVSRFPFAVTAHLQFALWYVSFGIGKGYDQ